MTTKREMISRVTSDLGNLREDLVLLVDEERLDLSDLADEMSAEIEACEERIAGILRRYDYSRP
jgi:hypothetical protein